MIHNPVVDEADQHSFKREDKTEQTIKLFTQVLPPLLIMVMAPIVVLIIAAVILPLIEMQQSLGM